MTFQGLVGANHFDAGMTRARRGPNMLRPDHQPADVPGEHELLPESFGAAEIADEGASNWALAPDATASSPESRSPGPEAGTAPDEGGIHWHEQPEAGLADGHSRADDDRSESVEVS